MLARLFYAIRCAFWLVGNLRRRMGAPPEYVAFMLEGPYQELPDPPAGFLQRRLSQPKQSLSELAEQIRRVAGDPRVRGVVLHLRPLSMPLSQLQTLRGLIAELRAAGKRVVAWANSYDSAGYYVACAADKVIIQPGGVVQPLGTQRGFLFLADALKRIGLKADFVRTTAYKSAGDPLSRRGMSDEMREMIDWLMDDIHAGFVDAIAQGRGLDKAAAEALVDGAPYDDIGAVDAGVVDTIIGEEDLPAHLHSPLADWEIARGRLLKPRPVPPSRYVALLRIEGDIVDGRSQRPPSGGPALLRALMRPRAGDISVVQEARRVARDRRAAAVVLYVDSRGGSATASEAMAAALEKLARRKPLIVAMGAVAGSGGYYVSTPARWIVAQPGALTGSIGVLAGKVADVGLKRRLSLNWETATRGRRAAMFAGDRPFTLEEREIVAGLIDRFYLAFVSRVARSRKIPVANVDEIGGGRVWTGSQAMERGLVDELGGVDRAIAKAREIAGLHPRARVREVRPAKGPLLPPIPQTTALLDHALYGINLLGSGAPLYLTPLLWDE